MQLEVIMDLILDIKTVSTIVGIIVTIVIFFMRMESNQKKMFEKIEESRQTLSDEHTRHDTKLVEKVSDMVARLESHISKEEVESAFQRISREEVTEIRKILTDRRTK